MVFDEPVAASLHEDIGVTARLAKRVEIVLLDRAPPAQIPVLGRPNNRLLVAYLLDRDRDQPLRRRIKGIRQNPSKAPELPECMHEIAMRAAIASHPAEQ